MGAERRKVSAGTASQAIDAWALLLIEMLANAKTATNALITRTLHFIRLPPWSSGAGEAGAKPIMAYSLRGEYTNATLCIIITTRNVTRTPSSDSNLPLAVAHGLVRLSFAART